MNSPGFDFTLLKAMRYQFFLDHDGRYPSVLLLNPADFERLEREFSIVGNFMATRIIRSMDIDYGTFCFYLNLKAE